MLIRLSRLIVFVGLLFAVAAMPALGQAPVPQLTRLLESDMSQPSEMLPQGVPTWWNWTTHPRLSPVHHAGRYHAFTPWGQLYQCANTHVKVGELTELRDLQTWVLLRRARYWTRVQTTSAMTGGAFAEDYVGPNAHAHYRTSKLATFVYPVRGHNFHFWPAQGRIPFRPGQISAVTVALQARLAASPKTAGRAPCLTLSVGGDVWGSLNGDTPETAHQDIGIGRFKRVTRRWRLFTMTTASDVTLNRRRPPAIGPPRYAF